MALSTTKGVFRWISGKSKSAAYKFKTPRGSIGVRGTSFDLYVGPNADKLMIYGGAVRYCTNGGNCKELRGRCQMLIIDGSGVHDPVRYNSRRGSGGQFPFIGDAGLQSQFRLGSSSCLSSGRVTPRENDVLDESPGRDDPTPSPTPKASPGDGGSSGGGGTDGGGTGGEVDGD